MQRIAICYPTKSLASQVAQWALAREDCRIETVRARSAIGIRRALGGAHLALIDASDDHAQAIDLFSNTVAGLGARQTSVYTERMHEGLEHFVRRQGAWLLLGPLAEREWEDYFATLLPVATGLQDAIGLQDATRLRRQDAALQAPLDDADGNHSPWRKAA